MVNFDKTVCQRTAVIVGASSGIGEALARRLSDGGWRVGLMARRLELLNTIAADIGGAQTGREVFVQAIDLCDPANAASTLSGLLARMNPVDLVVISSGTGSLNRDLAWEQDKGTCAVNVAGFTAIAQTAMRYFIECGVGHLVGITSIAALRGNAASAAYCASKAYQSTYLDGLRDLIRSKRLPITVTEIQPGFVDTAMMKTEEPLSPIVRRLLVASPAQAADQIASAIKRRANHAYAPRRYALIAALIKCLPRPG